MRRLVYSPKAYAFVQTEDHPEGLDLSDYIVRGNVHRRTGAASTAELELRNPSKTFTKPGAPTFRPMDPITIFLTRLKNRPIQVFTGYLDTTPYLQLFPGTVKLSASCTLKRLLYTYWDPSLPYVFSGFLREFGWNVDPKTGSMISDEAYSGPTLAETKGELNDGSMGALLFATLRHVGHWDSDSIYIEALPDGIASKMEDMFGQTEERNKGISDNIAKLATAIAGTGSAGTGGGPMADIPEVGKDGVYKIGEIVRLALALGLRGNNAAIAAAVAMAESGGRTSVVNELNCVGLWQIRATVHKTYTEEELKDPVKNGKEMMRISNNGTNWAGPWEAFSNGNYLDFMADAKSALALVGGIPTLEEWSESVTNRNSRTTSTDPRTESGVAPAAISSTPAATSAGTTAGTPKEIIDSIVLPIARDCGINKSAAQNDVDNHNHTHLGSASDHAGPPNEKWAADMSNGGSPTPEMDKLARALATRFDIPWSGSGLVSATHNGVRFQLIYRYSDAQAGNHFDHVHFGVKGSGTAPAGPTVTVFLEGDSIGVGAAPHVKKRFTGLRSSVLASRTSTQGLADLRNQWKTKESDVLVVLLGSNDTSAATFRTNVQAVMTLVGAKTEVIWVNVVGGVVDGVPDTDFNDVLNNEAGKRDNLTILDWKGAAVDGLLAADGTHATAKGYVTLGRLIGEAVDTKTATPTTTGDAGTSTGSGASPNASAFAAYLNLPAVLDVAEAIGLSGQKSLLNDQPLFPFIQQVAGASLRNFQSMPNGNFFGFFPDYFGGFGHRTPYWLIDDIEILDGGIDLTDEALATNVFIVGDVAGNFDHQVTFEDRLLSGGVMDLGTAFKSGFLGKGLLSDGGLTDFLKRYGVRPYKEENPIIRSPYYEAFLSYQRFMELWAKQFATTFQFTFMPELYPGGIVGLQDHGIQCYVEEVMHSFDYESGFTTQAVLSAPAAMENAPVDGISAGMVRGFDYTKRINTDNQDTGGDKVKTK